MPKPKSKAETQRDVMAILMGEVTQKPKTDTLPSLDIDDLVPFTNHPFKLYEGARLDDMVRSVRELGVLLPVIVRTLDRDDGTYEILSGHNRVNAAKIAGLTEIPVVVKDGLTDDEAALIVTETNLIQRSFADLTHSQRAIALKRHMDAIKSQGKRNDLLDEIERLSNPHDYVENGTKALLVQKLQSREITAEKYGLNRMTVTRYLRLSHLIQTLLDRVDDDEIGLYPAVSLSYLSPDEQDELNRLLGEASYKVDMKKAGVLRELSEAGKLTPDKTEQVLSGELNKKSKPKTAPPFKLKARIYQKYFDGDTPQGEMEAIIDHALAEYFEKHKEEIA